MPSFIVVLLQGRRLINGPQRRHGTDAQLPVKIVSREQKRSSSTCGGRELLARHRHAQRFNGAIAAVRGGFAARHVARVRRHDGRRGGAEQRDGDVAPQEQRLSVDDARRLHCCVEPGRLLRAQRERGDRLRAREERRVLQRRPR
ncbi:MAG: hypothetical protein HYS27_23190 [Deltaproteobacteria bacterium]|nr:hypothetical protein [Deltaproteobacteria bacterium]